MKRWASLSIVSACMGCEASEQTVAVEFDDYELQRITRAEHLPRIIREVTECFTEKALELILKGASGVWQKDA